MRRFLALTSAICCLLPAFATAAPKEHQAREADDIARQRDAWFYGQRAYPHPRIPGGARLRALSELTGMRALESERITPKALKWAAVGPQPIDTPYTDPIVSGRVTALAVDPTNPQHVYLGGAQGGVWQTTNGGKQWQSLTDGEPTLATGSIALDPATPSTIYIGTGEENFSGDSYYGAGILKSTDGGATWTQYCGPFCGPVANDGYYGGGARIGGLAVQPGNSNVLLAAVALDFEDGIYRSTDGGQTWTQVLAGNPGTSVFFDPATPATAYAALGDSFSGGTEGVFVSTNAGETWTAKNGKGKNALPTGSAGRVVLTLAPSEPQTLYVSLANVNDGSLLGVYKSSNGGTSWTNLSAPDYCTPQCSYDNVLGVAPTDPKIVYAGGAYTTTLIRTLDSGNTWSQLQSAQNGGFLHADMHALAFSADGSRLYLGNDGGAYSTTKIKAASPVFTGLNPSLSLTQFYPGLSIVPGNPGSAIGGTQDNGTVLYSGTPTWQDVTCGDGGYTAIDPVTTSTMYATCQDIFIEKNTAGGASNAWNLAESGINTSDRVDFIPPMVMDMAHSTTLYFGTYRVYQTTNGASTWNAISPDLTNGPSFWGVVTAIAVAPTDSNTVYAGTGDSNVQVTSNAATGTSATWTNVTDSGELPPRVITSLAVDPTTASTAYVGFSGFTGFGDSLGHVFQTTNRGASWTDVSGNLPNVPVNAVIINPAKRTQIFVGTDIGVFYSDTSGTSWTSLVDGLPSIAVLGLTLDSATGTLRAATHGRGAWDLKVSTLH
jgi:photosystem II stability/assembly factor-like uncharacterized protein